MADGDWKLSNGDGRPSEAFDFLRELRGVGRELFDRRPVARLDRVLRGDPRAAAADDLRHREVVRDVRELHAARGHEHDARPAERSEEVLDVLHAPRGLRREELHHRTAQRQRLRKLARRRNAWTERHAHRARRRDDARIEARRHARFRARGLRGLELLEPEHGARDQHRTRDLGLDLRDRLRRARGAEGDLQHGEPPLDERTRQRHGLLDVVDHNDGDDARVAQRLYHVHVFKGFKGLRGGGLEVGLAVDARGTAAHELLDVGLRGHRGVAGGRHRERAVRRAVVHRLRGVVERHEAVDEAGRERIAAADAVVDLEAGALDGLVELALVPADRAPVVDRRGLDRAQRRRDRLEVRVDRHRLVDHLAEALDLERRHVLVDAFDRDAERRREVLLVADHDVHVLRDLAVDRLRLLLSADRLPEARAVVEVIARHRAVLLGRLERLDRDLGRRLGKRREDAARVEPAHALLPEQRVPVDVAGLQLRDGRQPAVRAAARAAAAVAALDEVEAVPDRAADAVVRHPLHVRDIDAALQHEVLDEASDGILRERRDRRRPETEAAPEAAHDVVFAAAFPDLEFAGRVDAPIARIEAEHDFTQRGGIPHAGPRRLDV